MWVGGFVRTAIKRVGGKDEREEKKKLGEGQDEGNSFAKKDVWLHARAKSHVRDAGVSAHLFKKDSRRERWRTRGGRGGGVTGWHLDHHLGRRRYAEGHHFRGVVVGFYSLFFRDGFRMKAARGA